MSKPYTEVLVEQGTLEWMHARCGMITGSRAADFARTLARGTFAAARTDYLMELLSERLTGRLEEPKPPTPAMLRGLQLEPEARAAYEDLTGWMVTRAGFYVSTAFDRVGCSVDGRVVENDWLVEIKCPKASKILTYRRSPDVPAEYRYQLAHNLLVTGAEACDLVLYHPDLPEALQVTRWTVTPDMVEMREYQDVLLGFIQELDRVEEEVRRAA